MRNFISFFVFLATINVFAQWQNAIIHTVDNVSGIPSTAQGIYDGMGNFYVIWETEENTDLNLYFSVRDADGIWASSLKIADDVLPGQSELAAASDFAYVSYTKADQNVYLARLEAPLTVTFNQAVVSNLAYDKFNLNLAVDADDNAHLAWAMLDIDTDEYKLYYYNNSEIGDILGANKLSFSSMGDAANPLDIAVNTSGEVTIAYIGKLFNNQQRVQIAFNTEINSTSWIYNTYFGTDDSTFGNVKALINEGKVHYLAQGSNNYYYLQTDIGINDSWETAVIVAPSGGTLDAFAVQATNQFHASIIGENNELYYATNDTETSWTNSILLDDANYLNGSLCFSPTNAINWVGIRDTEVVIFGDEVIVNNDVLTQLDNTIQLYPNPAKNFVTIQGDFIQSAKIYNAAGQIVKQQNSFSNTSINIQDLSSGVYVVVLQTENNIYQSRLIKQ